MFSFGTMPTRSSMKIIFFSFLSFYVSFFFPLFVPRFVGSPGFPHFVHDGVTSARGGRGRRGGRGLVCGGHGRRSHFHSQERGHVAGVEIRRRCKTNVPSTAVS